MSNYSSCLALVLIFISLEYLFYKCITCRFGFGSSSYFCLNCKCSYENRIKVENCIVSVVVGTVLWGFFIAVVQSESLELGGDGFISFLHSGLLPWVDIFSVPPLWDGSVGKTVRLCGVWCAESRGCLYPVLELYWWCWTWFVCKFLHFMVHLKGC